VVQIGYVDQKVCVYSLDHFMRIHFECLLSVKKCVQNCSLVPVFQQKVYLFSGVHLLCITGDRASQPPKDDMQPISVYIV